MSVRRFATTLAATAAAIRASGIYFAGALDNLGIASEVKAKAKTPAGGHVPVLVAKGEAELGVQMIGELRGVPGTDFLGRLPGELQMFTIFPAALFPAAKAPGAVQSFIRFLTAPEAARVYQAGGMEPG